MAAGYAGSALVGQVVAERKRSGIAVLTGMVPVAIIRNAAGKWMAARQNDIDAGKAIPYPSGAFSLDGEPINLGEFLCDNDLEEEQVAAIANLQPGESMNFGGGAAATFVLRREGGGA